MVRSATGIASSRKITRLNDLDTCMFVVFFLLSIRIVNDHLCPHVLMTHTAVLMANDIINARLIELYCCFVDSTVNRHHVDVLLGDIETMHHIFGSQVEVHFAAYRYIDL